MFLVRVRELSGRYADKLINQEDMIIDGVHYINQSYNEGRTHSAVEFLIHLVRQEDHH